MRGADAVAPGAAGGDALVNLANIRAHQDWGLGGLGFFCRQVLPVWWGILCVQAEKRRLEKERNRWVAEQLRRQRELEAKEKEAVRTGLQFVFRIHCWFCMCRAGVSSSTTLKPRRRRR